MTYNRLEEAREANRVREILATVKPLAAEYYRLTQKPLGVTGEVAEFVASELFGLTLAPPRTAGYDAIRCTPVGDVKVQIKGRAFGVTTTSQRIGTIKRDAECDIVMLVLLDNSTLEPREVWEASYHIVVEALSKPGSKARDRGALSVSAFKKIGQKTWPNS